MPGHLLSAVFLDNGYRCNGTLWCQAINKCQLHTISHTQGKKENDFLIVPFLGYVEVLDAHVSQFAFN